jgi:hypothetical protein
VDEELTPEQKFAGEPTLADIYRALLAGKRREDVIADLMRYDYTEYGAATLVSRAEEDIHRLRASPDNRAVMMDEATKQAVTGACIAGGGILLSVFSVMLVLASGGGVVFVPAAGGAVGVLTGFIMLFRGLTRRKLFREIGDRPDGG